MIAHFMTFACNEIQDFRCSYIHGKFVTLVKIYEVTQGSVY